MKTRTLWLVALLAIGVLTLTGCNCNKNNSEETNVNEEVNTNVEVNVNEEENAAEEMVGMANPASVYCVEQGWELIPMEDEEWNQYAMCRLADGTEVEEWEYFRANNSVEEENVEETTEEVATEGTSAEDVAEETVTEEVVAEEVAE